MGYQKTAEELVKTGEKFKSDSNKKEALNSVLNQYGRSGANVAGPKPVQEGSTASSNKGPK